ncbi:MAG: TRAM domain-containing protein [Armatimonadota bacterium]|nr:TRAM domain-containing protein [Armatimonadota bacterium]
MRLSSKLFRPLVTFIMVILGSCGGYKVAQQYLRLIDAYLRGESSWFLWIPQNPTQLTKSDRLWLTAAFMLVGAMLAFVVERLAYAQANRARERWNSMLPTERLLFFGGLLSGLLLTALIRSILAPPVWLTLALTVILCYVSVVAFESLKEQVRFYFPVPAAPEKLGERRFSKPKLLDTNVIIDGRIADICRTGFLEGPVYVPRFVLDELQLIADSSDSLKRARGRRGLEILNQMQKEIGLEIPDFPGIGAAGDVDARLVSAAQQLGGVIVTNDYNLNRVAELQGVEVLNINELANALKPVVLPGEEMRVTIVKEGKERDQGVAYLDDGTMIVVEGAKKLIDQTLDIVVTSVLQTVQGKMIFGKIKEPVETEPTQEDESIRTYTGSRLRRKTR